MPFRVHRLLKIGIVAVLIGWYGFFLATPVIFSTGDLGRHLMNGKVFLASLHDGPHLQALLHTNFYSYTFSEFPFINHHWGTGVLFYTLWLVAGFKGLAIFYILLSLFTGWFFFDVASKRAGFKTAAILAFFLIPLIAERVEIRPEGFSYFFAGLFVWLLSKYSNGKISFRTLFLLPLFQIIWANLHIYFFLGPVLIGVFWVERLLNQPNKLAELKKFGLLLFSILTASCITPFGIQGLLYPLTIFHNYGIGVSENQPGWLLVQTGWKSANYIILKLAYGLLTTGFIALFFTKRRPWPWVWFFCSFGFGVMAWTAVRNYTLFGFFALPTLATLANQLAPLALKWNQKTQRAATILTATILVFVTVFVNYQRIINRTKEFGIGILPTTPNAARFFLDNKLHGPIFNDFDIGGYLIWYLFPEEKVFVDNRPEAYPASAFQDLFIPMHTDDALWRKKSEEYKLNALIFSFDDNAPWTLPFIVARLTDPEWVPVFADKSVIIFVKRAKENEEVIKKYEIPRDRFGLEEKTS